MSNVLLATYRASLTACGRRQTICGISSHGFGPRKRNASDTCIDGIPTRYVSQDRAIAARYFHSLSRRFLSNSAVCAARRSGQAEKKQRPFDHAKPWAFPAAGGAETDQQIEVYPGQEDAPAEGPQSESRLQTPDPRHYSLPDQPYDQSQIDSIFGKDAKLSVRQGNYILAVVHQRRLSGSIAEEGISEPQQGGNWSRTAAAEALQWLRLKHPVDEEETAARWAEEEVRRLEQDLYTKRGVSWGLIKSTGEEEKSPGPTVSPYAGGALAELTREIKKNRKANEKKRELEQEEEAELQEKERMRMQAKLLRERKQQTKAATAAAQQVDKSGRSKSGREVQKHITQEELEEWGGYERESQWSRRYRQQAAMSARRETPKMSKLARLGPSTVVAALAIAGCFLLSAYYNPSDIRLFPDVPPSAATCMTIIALNTLVLFAWRYPPFWRVMNEYFVMTPGYPYAASIIGNTISHQKFSHIFLNMLLVGTGGVLFHEMVGRGDFLAIYLGAGVFGSWLSLTTSVATNVLYTSTFGASACVCGLIAGSAVLAPNHTWIVHIPFTDTYIPVWTMFALSTFVSAEVLGLVVKRGNLDHWSHLGGYIAGAVGGSLLQRRYTDRARKAEQMRRDGALSGSTAWRRDADPKDGLHKS